ncbi:hypothetical protein ACJ41O_009884 [Fusarium nematophilum]
MSTNTRQDAGTRNPKKAKRSLSSVLASRSSRWRPKLQALPAEVLESIFLYSASLSLPRSASIIGAKLSGRATLLRLFIWAFHDTWDQWFGIPREGHMGQDKRSTSRLVDGDPVFQSAVLDLPWVNIDFILQAQQTWADTYARDRHYEHCLPRFEGDGMPIRPRSEHAFDGGPGHFDARRCFEADYQEVLGWEPFRKVEPWGFHDVHPEIRLPGDLDTGPWDDEKLRRLFWISRGGGICYFEEDQEELPPWEARLECLRNAYVDAPVPNTLISNCIDLAWMCAGLPRDMAREERRRIDQRLNWGADNAIGKEILRYVHRNIGDFHAGFNAPGSAS